MRHFSPSLRGVPLIGRLFYGAVLGVCAVIVLYGLREGPLFISGAALVVIVPFIFAAPFVFGQRWKAPQKRLTRRPVVRRRRW